MIKGFVNYVASYLYKVENKINSNENDDVNKYMSNDMGWEIFGEVQEKDLKCSIENKCEENKSKEYKCEENKREYHNIKKIKINKKKSKEWKVYGKKFSIYESKQKREKYYSNYNEKNIQNRYHILQPKRKQLY